MDRITIRDISWGINRVTGERSEKLIEEKVFDGPFEVGQKLSLKVTRKDFEILNVSLESVSLRVSPVRDITLTPFKLMKPLPKSLSMDGGHSYTFLYEYDYLEIYNEKHELINRYRYGNNTKITLPEQYHKQVYVGPDAGFNLEDIMILENGNIYFAMNEYKLENDVELEVSPLKIGPTLYFKKHLLER